MRVTGLVRVDVVATVMGHPADQRALRRHRTGHPERDPQGSSGPETPVREEAVESKRDAQPRDHIQGATQTEIEPADPVMPEQPDGKTEHGQRQNDDHCCDELIGPPRP